MILEWRFQNNGGHRVPSTQTYRTKSRRILLIFFTSLDTLRDHIYILTSIMQYTGVLKIDDW